MKFFSRKTLLLELGVTLPGAFLVTLGALLLVQPTWYPYVIAVLCVFLGFGVSVGSLLFLRLKRKYDLLREGFQASLVVSQREKKSAEPMTFIQTEGESRKKVVLH